MLDKRSLESFLKNQSLNSYTLISALFLLFSITTISLYYYQNSVNSKFYEDSLNKNITIVYLSELRGIVKSKESTGFKTNIIDEFGEKVFFLKKNLTIYEENKSCSNVNQSLSNLNIFPDESGLVIFKRNTLQCIEYIGKKVLEEINEFKKDSKIVHLTDIVLIVLFLALLCIFIIYGYFITNILDKLIKNKLLFSSIDLAIVNSVGEKEIIEKVMKNIGSRLDFDVGIYWDNINNVLVYKEYYAIKNDLIKMINNVKENFINKNINKEIYDGINEADDDNNYLGKLLFKKFNMTKRVSIPIIYGENNFGELEFFYRREKSVFSMNSDVNLYKKISHYLGKIIYKKVAEKELGETRNLLEQQRYALDASAIVAITDLTGKIKYVNEKFVELSGFSKEELIGNDHRIINSGHHPKEFFVNLWKTIAKGKIWHFEVKNKRKDGTYYWVDSTVVPIHNSNGKVIQYIAIRFDISHKKEMEEVLLKARESAEENVKNKGLFFANMSHEIRTPLNAMLGTINILSDEVKTENAKKYLKIIKASGHNLTNLLNDILDFSKIEVKMLKLENISFNLIDAIHECVSILGVKAIEKKLPIYVDIDPKIPMWIIGDISRVKQVIVNLLSNAIKFTTSGSITVKVECAKDFNNMNIITISIIDTGIGLTEDFKNKIFNSFSQADASIARKFGGTGLGLAICKGICEAMGGEIFVNSEFGKGSAFSFKFKAMEGEPIVINENSNKIDKEMAKKFPLNILVADDNFNNQFVISKFLEKLGYNPEIVSNGKEVLDILTTKNYDLIFMDCYMPEMNGFETTSVIYQTIQAQNRPWIVALTANVSIDDREKCKKMGMNDFIGKPFNIEDIISSLNLFLKSKKNIGLKRSENIMSLNKEKILKHFSDDEKIMKRYIELFFLYIPKMLSDIECSIEKNDARELEISAHKLKGNIGSFFVDEITKDLLILEEKGRHGDLDGANELFQKIKEKMNSLLEGLNFLI
ncbi:PAS domain-containing hybrid sensor histidine kinase/response regulator [Fluviispira multicolorata]|uniref:histidine kinase n=1 Tax=Fluviispira multicolorata TaxID=2654512 RepID=A0A833N3Q7_9BACT|nr:PAS domain-containing hybrid sensor histidine kinase/response regulator [Fluviispira multicolorata]KAB8029107.1 response regulator [Fluviispira multicolorata]